MNKEFTKFESKNVLDGPLTLEIFIFLRVTLDAHSSWKEVIFNVKILHFAYMLGDLYMLKRVWLTPLCGELRPLCACSTMTIRTPITLHYRIPVLIVSFPAFYLYLTTHSVPLNLHKPLHTYE